MTNQNANATQSQIWFNQYNQFEQNFITEAVAKTASGEWDSFEIIARERAHILEWLENSEKFQNYPYNSPGLGVMEDLKLALGSFLSEILTSKYFSEYVKLYLED